jgi:hypothetical protein
VGTTVFEVLLVSLWLPVLGPFLERQRVTEPHGVIAGRGNQPAAVRAEGHRMDVVLVATQFGHVFPGAGTPQTDRVIDDGGGQASAVRVKGHTS